MRRQAEWPGAAGSETPGARSRKHRSGAKVSCKIIVDLSPLGVVVVVVCVCVVDLCKGSIC